MCRSRWPCRLRRRPFAARLLDRGLESSWKNGCLSLLFFVSCVGSGLCDELITHSEESYHVCVCVCLIVCDLEKSTMRRPRPELGCCAIKKNMGRLLHSLLYFPISFRPKPFRQNLLVIWKFSAFWMSHKIMQWSLTVTEPEGTEIFSNARGFRLIQVLEVKITKTPDHLECKYFHYNHVCVSDSFHGIYILCKSLKNTLTCLWVNDQLDAQLRHIIRVLL